MAVVVYLGRDVGSPFVHAQADAPVRIEHNPVISKVGRCTAVGSCAERSPAATELKGLDSLESGASGVTRDWSSGVGHGRENLTRPSLWTC